MITSLGLIQKAVFLRNYKNASFKLEALFSSFSRIEYIRPCFLLQLTLWFTYDIFWPTAPFFMLQKISRVRGWQQEYVTIGHFVAADQICSEFLKWKTMHFLL